MFVYDDQDGSEKHNNAMQEKCPMKKDQHELFEETHRKSDNRTKKEKKKD